MARVVPTAVDPDARAAAELARSILSGPRSESRSGPLAEAGLAGAALLAEAGLLDPSLPRVVAVEVLREAGRSGCASGLALAGDSPLLAAATLCGAAEAVAEVGMSYATTRVVFGRPLAKMPVQRYAFASVAASVEAATALVRRVAASSDAGSPDPVESASLVPVALDAAWGAAEAALQVHGGYGYSDEYPVSRMWREIAAARASFLRG